MWEMISALIVTGITIIGFVYGFLRNFKLDMHDQIKEIRDDMKIMDERIFWLSTGRNLAEVILEEKMKVKDK